METIKYEIVRLIVLLDILLLSILMIKKGITKLLDNFY